jgi:hypothetical protein
MRGGVRRFPAIHLVLDNAPNEPHRKHVAYDAGGKRFFVANRAMNRVEVFSASNLSVQTTIDASGAASVDLSADGKTLWVGTSLEQFLAIDTGTLQAQSRFAVWRAECVPYPSGWGSDQRRESPGGRCSGLPEFRARPGCRDKRKDSLRRSWGGRRRHDRLQFLSGANRSVCQPAAVSSACSRDAWLRQARPRGWGSFQVPLFWEWVQWQWRWRWIRREQPQKRNIPSHPLSPTRTPAGSYFSYGCPSGALIYEPFLDGPPPDAPPAKGIRGGINIRDAHNGRLRL